MNYYSVNRHYFLWVKEECDWCVKAIGLLNKEGFSYSAFGMDDRPTLLEEAKKNFEWETVPIVFEIRADGVATLVGGFTDLEQHLKEVKENDPLYTSPHQSK